MPKQVRSGKEVPRQLLHTQAKYDIWNFQIPSSNPARQRINQCVLYSVGWLCRCAGIVWEPIRNRAHMQLVREHSVTVIYVHWATVDWSWPKEWNWCAQANLHFKKKKKSTGREWMSNILQKSQHARKKPPPHSQLRTFTAPCDFYDCERETLAQIIHGHNCSKLCRRAMRDNMTLS